MSPNGLFTAVLSRMNDLQAKHLLAPTLLATCIGLLVALAILHFAPIGEIINSHSQYVSTKEFKELDSYEQLIVARMLREKSLLTVDSLWSMQVSFYQTMISVLIALNAAIVGGAFVIIRSSSKAEVVKESKAHFDEYCKAGAFTKIIEKKAKKEIVKINATYGDILDLLSEHETRMEARMSDHEARIDAQKDAILEVSNRLAELDESENYSDGDGKISE